MINIRMRFIWIFTFLAFSCSKTITKNEIVGLWELEEVVIDALVEPYEPTFIDIHDNSTFALAKTSGDRIGIYKLKNNHLQLKSDDLKWFNLKWNVQYFDTYFILQGTVYPYNYTKLKFRRIEQIPDFKEFEDRLVGKWQLYKIQQNEHVEKVSDTWFHIDDGGNYSIVENGETQEKGRAIINTRHRKIIFEMGNMQWNAWFYGRELRLDNEEQGIQYRLRRVDEH